MVHGRRKKPTDPTAAHPRGLRLAPTPMPIAKEADDDQR